MKSAASLFMLLFAQTSFANPAFWWPKNPCTLSGWHQIDDRAETGWAAPSKKREYYFHPNLTAMQIMSASVTGVDPMSQLTVSRYYSQEHCRLEFYGKKKESGELHCRVPMWTPGATPKESVVDKDIVVKFQNVRQMNVGVGAFVLGIGIRAYVRGGEADFEVPGEKTLRGMLFFTGECF